VIFVKSSRMKSGFVFQIITEDLKHDVCVDIKFPQNRMQNNIKKIKFLESGHQSSKES
jgi:hypothetical protein